MKRNIVELLWTMVFILIAWLSNDPLAIGIAYGIILCVTLPFSSGYLNPAITLAMWLQKKITLDSAIQYWVAQLIGWVLWALLVLFLQWAPMLIMPIDGISMWKIGVAEWLFTAFLGTVAIIISKKYDEKYLGALLLWLTLFVAILTVGKITGWVFNPALAIGGSFVDRIKGWSSGMFLWMYLITSLIGGATAGYLLHNRYEKL